MKHKEIVKEITWDLRIKHGVTYRTYGGKFLTEVRKGNIGINRINQE